jgi:hypothetical protein
MTDTPAHGALGATTLLFQAPPPPPGGVEDDHDAYDGGATRAGRRGQSTPQPGAASGTTGELRMLKGARAAATGMHITDEQIRAVLEDPQELAPDPSSPKRTRLMRDGLVVTTGHDGMILRVARKGRSPRPAKGGRPNAR